MLGFETLTFAPIDRNLIETAMLSPEERRWVDDYHADVLRIVGPQLDGEAKAWLEARLRAARLRLFLRLSPRFRCSARAPAPCGACRFSRSAAASRFARSSSFLAMVRLDIISASGHSAASPESDMLP